MVISIIIINMSRFPITMPSLFKKNSSDGKNEDSQKKEIVSTLDNMTFEEINKVMYYMVDLKKDTTYKSDYQKQFDKTNIPSELYDSIMTMEMLKNGEEAALSNVSGMTKTLFQIASKHGAAVEVKSQRHKYEVLSVTNTLDKYKTKDKFIKAYLAHFFRVKYNTEEAQKESSTFCNVLPENIRRKILATYPFDNDVHTTLTWKHVIETLMKNPKIRDELMSVFTLGPETRVIRRVVKMMPDMNLDGKSDKKAEVLYIGTPGIKEVKNTNWREIDIGECKNLEEYLTTTLTAYPVEFLIVKEYFESPEMEFLRVQTKGGGVKHHENCIGALKRDMFRYGYTEIDDNFSAFLMKMVALQKHSEDRPLTLTDIWLGLRGVYDSIENLFKSGYNTGFSYPGIAKAKFFNFWRYHIRSLDDPKKFTISSSLWNAIDAVRLLQYYNKRNPKIHLGSLSESGDGCTAYRKVQHLEAAIVPLAFPGGLGGLPTALTNQLNTLLKTQDNVITCVVDIDDEVEKTGQFPGVTGSFGSGNRSRFSLLFDQNSMNIRYNKMILELKNLYTITDKIGVNVKPITKHVSKIPFILTANGFSSNTTCPREFENDLLELDVFTEYTFVSIGTQTK
jgi:hypothetical protein